MSYGKLVMVHGRMKYSHGPYYRNVGDYFCGSAADKTSRGFFFEDLLDALENGDSDDRALASGDNNIFFNEKTKKYLSQVAEEDGVKLWDAEKRLFKEIIAMIKEGGRALGDRNRPQRIWLSPRVHKNQIDSLVLSDNEDGGFYLKVAIVTVTSGNGQRNRWIIDFHPNNWVEKDVQ